ncbi:MAG: hypothetical protein OK422_03100 [Thaumarchaeota archaeon]|nr:hypothetical protein [Nitrososphaerota archaeon]
MGNSVPDTLQKFGLCRRCLLRQGNSARFQQIPAAKCFICRGLTSKLLAFAKWAASKGRAYEYRTFSIGLTLPEGVQEREDELRAESKIKGFETIKSEMSRIISREISRLTGKRVDKMTPELMVLLNLQDHKITLTSRPVFLYGRYTKPEGLSQRKERCPHCGGRGCEVCKETGFDLKTSVEVVLQRKLGSALESDGVRITWMGSEDAESLVHPPGRPFIAEVKNPKKRGVPKRLFARTGKGEVQISHIRTLLGKPTKLPSFKFRARAYIEPTNKISPRDLRALNLGMNRVTVEFQRPQQRPIYRTVYSVRGKLAGDEVVVDIEMDGGLPVKRFVSGEAVSPSLSEVLKTELKCRKFDIYRVSETSELEFA